MKKQIALFLIVGLTGFQLVMGSPKYGDAVIKKGSLTVVRGGRTSIFNTSGTPIEIQQNDVLRAGRSSQIVLQTLEETTITIGSNAVFQVKPWQHRQKKGVLRMLYGKMLFKTKRLKGKRRFRLKTATAVMGVKGTEGNTEVGSTGNTILVCNTGICTMQGNLGNEIEVPQNSASMSTGRKTSNTFKAETETETDKEVANDPNSNSVSLEQEAVGAGVVEQGDLQQSKETQADIGEQIQTSEEANEQETEADETETASEETDFAEYVSDIIESAKETATEQSTHKTGKINVEFEK